MPHSAPEIAGDNSSPHGRIYRWIAIVLLIPVVLFALGMIALYVCSNFPNPYNGSSFIQKEWIDAGLNQHFNPNRRSPMAQDLIANHLPCGMTESQVIALLGHPEEDVRDRHFSSPKPGAHEYQYDVGGWSMHGWDSAFVVVEFDRQGKVEAAELGGY